MKNNKMTVKIFDGYKAKKAKFEFTESKRNLVKKIVSNFPEMHPDDVNSMLDECVNDGKIEMFHYGQFHGDFWIDISRR